MKHFIFGTILLLLASCSLAQPRQLHLTPTNNPSGQICKAVVIGMSHYKNADNLPNTLHDADDMSDVLRKLGFEVTLLEDNDKRSLEENLNDWYSKIEGSDIAIFYYSGHGMEIEHENYLAPIDVDMSTKANAKYSCLNVQQVLENMSAKNVKMKLAILDACRNLPQGWNDGRGLGDKGLAPMMSIPDGIYVAFATAANREARDGGEYNLSNGVYTHFLKRHYPTKCVS